MKRKFYYLSVALCTFVLFSCGKKSEGETAVTPQDTIIEAEGMDPLASTSDYLGIYKGYIPDQDGIEVTLSLNNDSTFVLYSVHYDKKDGILEEQGDFGVSNDGILTLFMEDDPNRYFKIEKGELQILDGYKKPITGKNADKFILKQIQPIK